MIEILTPTPDQEVSLKTELGRIFSSPEEEARRAAHDGNLNFKWYDLKQGENEQSLPAPVHVTWRVTEEEEAVAGYSILLISESEDLSSPVSVTMAEGYEADVYNLIPGKVYYLAVQKEGRRSETRRFSTLFELPRAIRIDGVSNVRDAGGYPTEDGGRVRFGLLYRGGEFERHMHITPDGVEAIKALGLRTDLDLRGEAVGVVEHGMLEPFGIERKLIPMGPYTSTIDEGGAEALRQIFALLADERSYPLYHHCWGGADRGGTLAFLIGALIGMRWEDLIFEYEFTTLSIWNIRSRNYHEFVAMTELLLSFEGDTPAKKAENLLLARGVSMEQINAVRRILVEKPQ